MIGLLVFIMINEVPTSSIGMNKHTLKSLLMFKFEHTLFVVHPWQKVENKMSRKFNSTLFHIKMHVKNVAHWFLFLVILENTYFGVLTKGYLRQSIPF
jgi:hypothetical protein